MTGASEQRKFFGIFHKHTWGKWEQGIQEEHVTPIGRIYPANVRGREFVTSTPIQRRICETCDRCQIEVSA